MNKEVKRLQVDIMGISETRWPDSGECSSEETTFYYSDSNNRDPQYRDCTGILLNDQLKKHIKRAPCCKSININIIQRYTPTADKLEDEASHFYEKVRGVLKSTNQQQAAVLLKKLHPKAVVTASAYVIIVFFSDNTTTPLSY